MSYFLIRVSLDHGGTYYYSKKENRKCFNDSGTNKFVGDVEYWTNVVGLAVEPKGRERGKMLLLHKKILPIHYLFFLHSLNFVLF